MSTGKIDVRQSRYKVAVEAQACRRKRENSLIEIRKIRREETLLKRRCEGLHVPQLPDASADTQLEKKKLEILPSLVAGVQSDDVSLQLKATTQIRELLSMGLNLPIEEVIQSGVVPWFVEFLSKDDDPQLLLEAAWALTNIASGTSDNTMAVIDHGAVPIFVKLLSSSSANVREQAVWALGNVAGNSPKCRDIVLRLGALMPLLAQFKKSATMSMLRTATWTLSNLCRGKPRPDDEQIIPAIPVLCRVLESRDKTLSTDACCALSHLCDGNDAMIQGMIDTGVCLRLVDLLGHHSSAVVLPTLRCVGNIINGDDAQTQAMIDSGALPSLKNLMSNHCKK